MLRLRGGVGHKPCTFYYSDHPDAPLDNNNSRVGPKSCDDIDEIGYFLKTFVWFVSMQSI